MMKALVGIILVAFAAPAFGAIPSITSVTSTGTVHMATFSVFGSNFGAGPTSGKPAYFWDGRSQSLDPGGLGRNTSWASNTSVSVISSEPATGTSNITQAIAGNWAYYATDLRHNYTHEVVASMAAGGPFYVSMWRRHTYDAAGKNLKLLRTDQQAAPRDWLHSFDSDNGNILRMYNQGNIFPDCSLGAGEFNCTSSGGGTDVPKDTWLKSQYEWSHGSVLCGSGGGTGKWRYVSNGSLVQYGDYFRNCDADQSEVEIQYAIVSGDAPVAGDQDFFTNIFMDDSFFQVFASSANSGGTCTRITTGTYVEPQITSSWAAGEIGARFNLGSIDTTHGVCVSVRNAFGVESMSEPQLVNASAGGGEPPPTEGPGNGTINLRGVQSPQGTFNYR